MSLPKLAVKNNKQLDLLKKCIPASYFTFYEKQALRPFANRIAPFDETGQVGDSEHSTPNSRWPSWRLRHRVCDFAHVSHVDYTYTLLG